MTAFFLTLLIIFSPLFASDGENNVSFPGLAYPFEKNITLSEKAGTILYETPYGESFSRTYNTVVMQGESGYTDLAVELHMKDSGLSLRPDIMKVYRNGRFWAKFKMPAGKKESFKIVFLNTGANKAFKLTIYEIQAFYETIKQKAEFQYVPDPSLSVPDTLKLIRRSDWQANPPKEPYTVHQPRAITIHHTAGKLTASLEESIAEIQFIQDYHQNAKGWNDIGYHFILDSLGNVFEGRPIKVVGAHVYMRNTDNVGISLMGNYHPPKNDQPSQKALEAIISIASYVVNAYSVEKSSFYAHRDIGSTDCPGDILYSKIPEIKKAVFESQTAEIDLSTTAVLSPVPGTLPDIFKP